MIIEAVVKIDLKNDGTWKIVGLKALTETKPPEEQPPKPGIIEKHFVNRDRIRKKRAREKSRIPHHCSQCGKAHRNKLTCPHV